MDPLILARLQFAITTVYHFFFVPLTLGLSILVAIMETFYVRTGDEVYKRMTKFWGKLFLINFAMGVVTGIVQEFQFGMNWSEYSRFVGDIFGAPLAIEALLAFFLESTFLGVWIFGWDKLSKGVHAAAIWLVAIGSNLSALWILIANSFMQEPVGYVLRNGRAEMTDFLRPADQPQRLGAVPARRARPGCTTAAFFVLGISAYHLLRKHEVDLFRRSFQIAAVVGAIGIVLVVLIGHSQAQHMVRDPADEDGRGRSAVGKTEIPASLLDPDHRRSGAAGGSVRHPHPAPAEPAGLQPARRRGEGHQRPAGRVRSSSTAPGNYVPPVAVIYWTFRIMVGAGFLHARPGAVCPVHGHGRYGNQPRALPAPVPVRHRPALPGQHGRLAADRDGAPALDRVWPDEDRERRLAHRWRGHGADLAGRSSPWSTAR